MSDEQNNKPQTTPKDYKPQEGPKEIKVIELNESFAGKSQPGDQGILLKPVGSHNTDPFVSQDTSVSPNVVALPVEPAAIALPVPAAIVLPVEPTAVDSVAVTPQSITPLTSPTPSKADTNNTNE